MATLEIPIIDFQVTPDVTGDCWFAPVSTELTLGNADGAKICGVLPAAATISADTGFKGGFQVPRGYVDTPVLVIRGILDGAPTTLVIAFGVQLRPLADDEAYDVAYNAQNIASASSVGQADEDVYEETISIADTLAAFDDVDWFFFIDDSVHTYTGKFLLTGLFFRYNDA
jgi:hypothetical protein